MNEREVILDSQPYCRACAGGAYYQAVGRNVILTYAVAQESAL